MSNILTKNDNLFFETFEKAKKNNDKAGLEQCLIALQGFFSEPKTVIKKKIQALSVSSDFPLLSGENYNITIGQDAFDLGYEEAFQDVPKTPGKNFWSVLAGDTSLTFIKVPEGGKLVAAGKTADKVTFYVDKYGGALGNSWEAKEFREVYAMIQDAVLFRNKFYTMKSDIFYAMLQAAALATGTTAYDGGADGQLRRDIRTINDAIYTLTYSLRNKGYGDMANVPVIIYASRSLENRINAALRASTDAQAAAVGSAVQITGRPIKVIYTYNTSITASRPIVCVPGKTITKQEYMAPTTYMAPLDVMSLNEVTAVWSVFGGGIGDAAQCRNFLLS